MNREIILSADDFASTWKVERNPDNDQGLVRGWGFDPDKIEVVDLARLVVTAARRGYPLKFYPIPCGVLPDRE